VLWAVIGVCRCSGCIALNLCATIFGGSIFARFLSHGNHSVEKVDNGKRANDEWKLRVQHDIKRLRNEAPGLRVM
jgi:hypothetical protein